MMLYFLIVSMSIEGGEEDVEVGLVEGNDEGGEDDVEVGPYDGFDDGRRVCGVVGLEVKLDGDREGASVD